MQRTANWKPAGIARSRTPVLPEKSYPRVAMAQSRKNWPGDDRWRPGDESIRYFRALVRLRAGADLLRTTRHVDAWTTSSPILWQAREVLGLKN